MNAEINKKGYEETNIKTRKTFFFVFFGPFSLFRIGSQINKGIEA